MKGMCACVARYAAPTAAEVAAAQRGKDEGA